MALMATGLTFTTAGTAGNWGADGTYTEGTAGALVNTTGEIEPYQEGFGTSLLPQGITATSAISVLSRAEVFITDPVANTEAYEMTYKNVEYVAWKVMDWSGGAVGYYECIFVRKDQNPYGATS